LTTFYETKMVMTNHNVAQSCYSVTGDKCKNDVYKNGYRRRSCTSKTAKIHRFVRFVMYCIITTVPVAFY